MRVRGFSPPGFSLLMSTHTYHFNSARIYLRSIKRSVKYKKKEAVQDFSHTTSVLELVVELDVVIRIGDSLVDVT